MEIQRARRDSRSMAGAQIRRRAIEAKARLIGSITWAVWEALRRGGDCLRAVDAHVELVTGWRRFSPETWFAR